VLYPLLSVAVSLPLSAASRSLPQLLERRVLLRVLLHHLGDRHLEVVLRHVHAPLAQREHARLRANGLGLGPGGLVHRLCNLAKVDAAGQVHLATVDGENVEARVLVRVRELDLAIDSARPQQCLVKDVNAVRGHDHFNLVGSLEAIQLVEELEHRALDLRVAAGLAVLARAADRVDLVHEDDRGRMLARHHEELAYHAGALANVLLDQLAARDTDEGAIRVVGDRAREQRLACAWRAVHEHSLGLRNP